MPRPADPLPTRAPSAARALPALAGWRRALRHTVTLSACAGGYVGALIGGTMALTNLALNAWCLSEFSNEVASELPTVGAIARSSLEAAWQAAAWEGGVIASGTVLWRLLVHQQWAPATVRALLSTIFGVALVGTTIALKPSQMDVIDALVLGLVHGLLALTQAGVAGAILEWAGHPTTRRSDTRRVQYTAASVARDP